MFCVYITIYHGDALPPFYIGSSSVARVNGGYHGTVVSKKYGAIWRREIKLRPDLFVTLIFSQHTTRHEALVAERQLQEEVDAVRNTMFINEALATPNGFFGRDVTGVNNPMCGKGHLVSGDKNGMFGVHRHGDKKLGRQGPEHWCYGKRVGPAHPMYGLSGADNPNTGKIWINNGSIRRFVKPEVAEAMAVQGFVRGYLKR